MIRGIDDVVKFKTEAGKYYYEEILKHCNDLRVKGNGIDLIKTQVAEGLFYSLLNAQKLLLLKTKVTNTDGKEDKEKKPALSPALFITRRRFHLKIARLILVGWAKHSVPTNWI